VPRTHYHFPTNGKQPVILGPKGIPYVAPQTMSAASLVAQKSVPVVVMPPAMFDDNNNPGLMMFHNHGGYEYSNEHMSGHSSNT
jgi:hypothetical protein